MGFEKVRPIAVGLLLVLTLEIAAVAKAQTSGSPQEELTRHSQLAQLYLKEHNSTKAIPELRAVVSLDPGNVEARANLGVLLFFQGEFASAVPELRAAVAQKPELWKLQALLGIAENRTGESVKGREDMEAAFPHLDEEKLKLQVGRELIENETASGDLDQAGVVVAALLKLDPANPGLLYTSYRIHADLMAEALLGLTLAAPESAQMHQAMAHELQRTHDLPDTTANLRKALALDPALPGIHFELAEALHASDDLRLRAEAEGQYRLAVESAPNDVKALTRLADIEAEKGELDPAAAHYDHALQIAPNSADAAIGKANVLSEKGNAAAAAPLLEHVIATDPANALAHFRLSTVYRKLHRPDDVKRELDAYLKYKQMREKLQDVYKEMRVASPVDDTSGEAATPAKIGSGK